MRLNQLTAEERRILALLVQGHRAKAIAERIGHTRGTMRVYMHRLYGKLGVPDQTAAAVWYMRNNKRSK